MGSFTRPTSTLCSNVRNQSLFRRSLLLFRLTIVCVFVLSQATARCQSFFPHPPMPLKTSEFCPLLLSSPLLPLLPFKLTVTAARIARFISMKLVEDGATLQVCVMSVHVFGVSSNPHPSCSLSACRPESVQSLIRYGTLALPCAFPA